MGQPRRPPPDDLEFMVRQCHFGLHALAKHYHCSKSTAQRWLREAGLATIHEKPMLGRGEPLIPHANVVPTLRPDASPPKPCAVAPTGTAGREMPSLLRHGGTIHGTQSVGSTSPIGTGTTNSEPAKTFSITAKMCNEIQTYTQQRIKNVLKLMMQVQPRADLRWVLELGRNTLADDEKAAAAELIERYFSYFPDAAREFSDADSALIVKCFERGLNHLKPWLTEKLDRLTLEQMHLHGEIRKVRKAKELDAVIKGIGQFFRKPDTPPPGNP